MKLVRFRQASVVQLGVVENGQVLPLTSLGFATASHDRARSGAYRCAVACAD